MTPAGFRKLALSMPGAHEAPHFERLSFRVGTKIFATLKPDGSEAMIAVKPVDLTLALIAAHPEAFFSYGGWTERNGSLGVRLKSCDAKLVKKLVTDAAARIAPRPGKKSKR